MAQKDFVNGVFFNKRTSQYGDFYTMNGEVQKFCDEIKRISENGKFSLYIGVSKAGKFFVAKNDYKPQINGAPTNPQQQAIPDDDLPF